MRQKFYQIDEEQKNLTKIKGYGSKPVPEKIDDAYIRGEKFDQLGRMQRQDGLIADILKDGEEAAGNYREALQSLEEQREQVLKLFDHD